MTNDEVQAKLNHWLAGVVNLPMVIDANSDRQRPALPYLSTNLTLSGPLYFHRSDTEFDTVNDETVSISVRDWYWRFSVFAYGGKPVEILQKVEAAFFYQDKLEPLNIFEMSPVRNIPDLVQNKIEPRANLDIEVRGVNRDRVSVDVIVEAPFQVERT